MNATTWRHSTTTVAELPAEDLQIRFRPTGSRSATYQLVDAHGTIFGDVRGHQPPGRASAGHSG